MRKSSLDRAIDIALEVSLALFAAWFTLAAIMALGALHP